MLERQLQQAGISVAEAIPYAVAKRRISEISKRMAEISDAEANGEGDNAALRREYFLLEQDMERYHTALMMSDEHIAEQAERERAWEAQHEEANDQALRLVRSAMPVDVAQLSEKALREMTTPSGREGIPADLARRFKRTNVLQLLRVAPSTILKMHPSVIEALRTTGLTLLERRALHHALRVVAAEWRKQDREEMSQRKSAWFRKLKDGLDSAIRASEQHAAQYHDPSAAIMCQLRGKACPVRSEAAMHALYDVALGFPEGEVFASQEIVKSDPEGAGEKARAEAQHYAREAVSNQRQLALKQFYGMNVRAVAQALGAMEEMDLAIERLLSLDESIDVRFFSKSQPTCESAEEAERWRVWERLNQEMWIAALLLARRSGICLTGKRDPSKDEVDTRADIEVLLAQRVLSVINAIAKDLAEAVGVVLSSAESSEVVQSQATTAKTGVSRLRELMLEIEAKNEQRIVSDAKSDYADADVISKRQPWRARTIVKCTNILSERTEPDKSSGILQSDGQADEGVSARAVVPHSAMLLDAIRAKRASKAATTSSDQSAEPEKHPLLDRPTNLLAAIRARRSRSIEGSNGLAPVTASSSA
ncbi:hypothetical protein PINS_up013355 [Pythium insidiosum]|nr:hypothetical protein PINS_up013355 [Pythium insidiosum]